MKRLFIPIVFLLGACSDAPDNAPADAVEKATIPGVYAGVFPCVDCDGIDSTLWLRADGRYFFKQRYPADEERKAMNAFSHGRWNWIEGEAAVALRGAGPVRIFEQLDVNTLNMRSNSELDHRLTRDPTAGHFSDSILMTGTIRTAGDGSVFEECLTGYRVALSKGGEFRKFRHQQRSTGTRNRPAFVELQGHFSWTDDDRPGALTIDRFVTVRADAEC